MSVEPFIPWDATDEEIAELLIVRESVPETLASPLATWLTREIQDETLYGYVQVDFIHNIETALRTPLGLGPGAAPNELVREIIERGQRFFLQVIDLLLTSYEPVMPWGRMPDRVASLAGQMNTTASALEIAERGGVYRLRRRLPEGIDEAAERAVSDANVTAGRHLAAAWREAQEMESDTSKILREGIQAVEAAAGPVVVPKERQPRLGKIVATIKAQDGWGLVLARRDDGHPDHKAVLVGMMETLVFAEQSRHSGPGYSPTEAVGHVQLAATLVGWFSSGVVVRAVP